MESLRSEKHNPPGDRGCPAAPGTWREATPITQKSQEVAEKLKILKLCRGWLRLSVVHLFLHSIVSDRFIWLKPMSCRFILFHSVSFVNSGNVTAFPSGLLNLISSNITLIYVSDAFFVLDWSALYADSWQVWIVESIHVSPSVWTLPIEFAAMQKFPCSTT